MKMQYIGVIAALALLAACAPKHDNTMATRLSKAERQILKKKTQPAAKPTPAPGKGSKNTGSTTGGTSTGTAGSGKGSGSSGKAGGGAVSVQPAGTSAQQKLPAQQKQPVQQAQDNMTVVRPNQTNAGSNKNQATAQTTSATCRLTTAAPTSGDIGSGNGSALQAINSYFASEPYCDSAAISVSNGEVILPQNLYQQKNIPAALGPVKVSSLGAYTSYTFQSLTPKTGRLELTYLLPGVNSKLLTQNDAQSISVMVSYNADSKSIEPFPKLGAFRLESIPTKTGNVTAIHILQASDLKYANYTLLVQVPNAFIAGSNPSNLTYQTNREITLPASAKSI